MGTMLKTIMNNVAITALAIGVPVRNNVTPLAGGTQRNALLINNAAIAGGGAVKIQGNPSPDAAAPADNDAGWADIVTLNAAAPLEQEIILPAWIRYNITTIGTGNATVSLEGIQ